MLPIGYLIVRASQGDRADLTELIFSKNTASLILRSLGLASAVTVSALVIAVALAYLTTRTNLKFRKFWILICCMPLALPSFVAAYVWASKVPEITGFIGAWLVLTICTYPYAYLPISAVLSRSDLAQEEVAKSLGHNSFKVFWQVTVPQIRAAATSGSLLIFLYVLSDFGAVSLLRFDAFTRVIYSSYRASFDRTPAAVYALILVAITIAVTIFETKVRGKELSRVTTDNSGIKTVIQLKSGRQLLAQSSLIGFAILTIGFPIYTIFSWTLQAITNSPEWSRLGSAVLTTTSWGSLGAAVTLLLALPISIVANRYRNKYTTSLEVVSFATHAVPGIAIGLALVFFSVRYIPWIYQELPLLILGYAILFIPTTMATVRTALARVSQQYVEVAAALGTTPRRIFTKITIPLALPGIIAGTALAMLTCFKELPLTLLLHPTGTETVATRLWQHTQVGSYAAAAPYAAVLLVVSAIPAILIWKAEAPK